MVNRQKKRLRKRGRPPGFKYHRRDPQEVKRRSEQSGSKFDSLWVGTAGSFRPRDGDNCVRILPPTWDDPTHFGYDAYVHRNVGKDSSSYWCRRKMLNEPCAVCDAADEARSAGEQDEAKALEPKKVLVVWLIDREGKDEDPELWAMSWNQDREISAQCINKRTGKTIVLDHPEEGYDLMFTREGKGKKTRYYGWMVDRDPSPISDNEREQERILEYIQDNPVPSMLKFYDNDYLEKVLMATTEDRDPDLDGEDEDEEEETQMGKTVPDRDDILDMSSKQLQKQIDKFELDVDLDEYSSLRKKRKAVAEALDEHREPGELPDADEVMEMSKTQIRSLIKQHRLDVDPDDGSLKKVRKRVIAALAEIEEEEEAEGDPEEEEEEEPPARKKKRGKKAGTSKKRRRRDEEEEEEEDDPEEEEEEDEPEEEEDPEEEEEEDEPPARKRGKKKAASKKRRRRDEEEEEEEEEDPEDEEEEEDEPPARKKRRRTSRGK